MPPTVAIPTSSAGFHEQGFARFDDLLPADEWAMLSAIYDDLFRDPETHPQFRQLGGTDAAGQQLMPQILSPHTTHPKLLQTTYFQRATELARVLLGENAELRTSHMILKPAGSKRDTPWHQDQSYHSPKFFYKNVNFWLPLDGASVDDGCMWFVPRTHAGMVFPHEQVGGDATATVALNADYWHQNGVPVPLPRGSVSAHHSYCMHYAGPNRSLRPRRAWILVFATEPRPLEEALVLPWQAD